MSISSSSGDLRARNRRSFKISGYQTQTAPPPPPSPSPVPENNGVTIMEEENTNYRDGPPLDDCCPICLGNFTIPCKSSCGHWYCGSCIMRYWSYCVVTMPCKCPKCARIITEFTPEASLLGQKEDDVVRVLGKVEEYNCLFVVGMRGLVQRVRRSPWLLKRFLLRLMDPDAGLLDLEHFTVPWYTFLGVLHIGFYFNFIPTEYIEVTVWVQLVGLILVIPRLVVGAYRRHRLLQRARAMAAANPLLG